MRSPFIGRGLALLCIVAFFTWTAVRSIGAGPASPKLPFPQARCRLSLGGSQRPGNPYSREAASGEFRACSST